jgi:hypothetical protein
MPRTVRQVIESADGVAVAVLDRFANECPGCDSASFEFGVPRLAPFAMNAARPTTFLGAVGHVTGAETGRGRPPVKELRQIYVKYVTWVAESRPRFGGI